MVILILVATDDFLIASGHFGYYVRRHWVLFNLLFGAVTMFRSWLMFWAVVLMKI